MTPLQEKKQKAIRSHLEKYPEATYKEIIDSLKRRDLFISTADISQTKKTSNGQSMQPRAGAKDYQELKELSRLIKTHGIVKIETGLRILKDLF